MANQTKSLVRRQCRWALCACFMLFNVSVLANNWHAIGPGLDYQRMGYTFTPWSYLHVFRLDLNLNELTLISAKDIAKPHATIREYAKHHKALLAINGGFFDKQYRPMGLRISEGQQKNPLKPISWWGVFYVTHHEPHIASFKSFKALSSGPIEFAIQSGPRLLVNGEVLPLKPGRAERSALCITTAGEVIIVATENTPLSTHEFALFLKNPPLNCVDALNLDGGSSTQLHAQTRVLTLDVRGYAPIADAILVGPRARMSSRGPSLFDMLVMKG